MRVKIAENRETFQSQLADYAFTKRQASLAVLNKYPSEESEQIRAHQLQDLSDKFYSGVSSWQEIPDDYLTDFKDYIGEIEHEPMIRARADLLGAYALNFANISSEISKTQMFNQGTESKVYKLGEFVVKLRHDREDRPFSRYQTAAESLDGSIVAHLRSRNSRNVEDLLAASYDDKTLVTKFMPGMELSKLNSEERFGLLASHWLSFEDFVAEMNELGVAGDLSYNFTNIFFDEKSREFRLIDPKPGLARIDILHSWAK